MTNRLLRAAGSACFVSILFMSLTAAGGAQPYNPPVYAAPDGVFVIEAEDARRTGDWGMAADDSAMAGGFAHWRGPNRYDLEQTLDPLTYCLRVTEPGAYHLRIRMKRSRRENPAIREDERNDLWIRQDGHDWMKLFANTPWDAWGWDGGLDFHHLNTQRPRATLTFEEPGVSCIQVAGRSEDVRLDRLHLSLSGENTDESLESTRTTLETADGLPGHGFLHHPMAFDFEGPLTRETADINPFTDYRLVVSLTPPGGGAPIQIRGFYAADGNAADSGAGEGRIWRAMVTPGEEGLWRWTARLARGSDIAIDRDPDAGRTLDLAVSSGTFEVTRAPTAPGDWRSAELGRLVARDGELVSSGSGRPWIKTGTNSPENLLAYEGFDGTYRLAGNARDGEADSGEALHRFAAHAADWRPGDPTWGGGEGRSLVGAVNYLAGNGVNAAYFLVWNIAGDGKDVWPFLEPEDQTRFDVSKLAQWERLFTHMQASGLALHMVLQETENELLMDGGDTGRNRRIFLSELAARYGHHNALIWNLGEENGPVHWRPEGQSDAQRIAMIEYLTLVDPYDHPIVLHTHSEPEDKDAIAGPLLGVAGLDGLSLQISDPTLVHEETRKWTDLSREAGAPWVMTMDEIGPWQHGAIPDADSEDAHLALLRETLWGHLLAGGSGVEWYFGAHHDHNDLTAEDFRSRQQIWRSSAAARRLLEATIDLAAREACPAAFSPPPCLRSQGRADEASTAIVYLRAGETLSGELANQLTAVEHRDPLDAQAPISAAPARDRVAVVRYQE